MKITVLSCSLDPRSKSRRLAQDAERFLIARGVEVRFVDCRSLGLPDFDHAACYESPAVRQLTDDLAWADGIVLAMPIYNWGGNSVAKRVAEATVPTWRARDFYVSLGFEETAVSVKRRLGA